MKLIILFYTFCLAGATVNHVLDLVRGGFLPYSQRWDVPQGLNIYWTSLTILDPLAILLLYLSLRKGLYLTILIMISDIIINLYSTYVYWDLTLFTNYGLQMQIFFGVFVFITAPIILYKSRNR